MKKIGGGFHKKGFTHFGALRAGFIARENNNILWHYPCWQLGNGVRTSKVKIRARKDGAIASTPTFTTGFTNYFGVHHLEDSYVVVRRDDGTLFAYKMQNGRLVGGGDDCGWHFHGFTSYVPVADDLLCIAQNQSGVWYDFHHEHGEAKFHGRDEVAAPGTFGQYRHFFGMGSSLIAVTKNGLLYRYRYNRSSLIFESKPVASHQGHEFLQYFGFAFDGEQIIAINEKGELWLIFASNG